MSSGIKHHVRLHGASEILPGEYTLEDGATVTRVAVDVPCPYCRAPLVHLKTTGAMRVGQQLGGPAGDVQTVLATIIPPTHRVLKCDPCKAIFTDGQAA